MKKNLRRIVYAICGFILAIIVNSSAWAQDSLANYHPLGKGNVWIYHITYLSGDNYYQRLEVIGDSTIDGKTYKIVAGTSMDGTIRRLSSVERYDDTTGCYFIRSNNTDVLQDSTFSSISHPNTMGMDDNRILKRLVTRSVFGIQLATREITEGIGVKEDQRSWIYAYGLGLIFADDVQLVTFISPWVQKLVYAKIDGMEYGNIPLHVDDRLHEVPASIVLSQNYPNPFNPSTTISFNLPSKMFVTLKIFDLIGREVSTLASEELPAGYYSKQWNASGFPSGVYFYRLQANAFSETKRLTILK
ncbi:MAG TPA: T9SS type A sorting domain-containing protein [Nitrosomonas sp.]|nr:T9SS type A sorting domain-containing protein [Nitrosomonas sp.]